MQVRVRPVFRCRHRRFPPCSGRTQETPYAKWTSRCNLEHMFESGDSEVASGSAVDAAVLSGFLRRIAHLKREVDDGARVDLLRVLESLKSACAAAQAKVAADLDTSTRRQRIAEGVPSGQCGVGIAAQIALARRDSPHRGGRHLGLAIALVHEMPHTLALLECGSLSEWRATILVRETACLTREDRSIVDRVLCSDPDVLASLGDRAIAAKARACAAELDAVSVARRAAKAVADRRVTVRPAPDTMVNFGALLPVAQGVAVYAALGAGADSVLAAGDGRTRAQIMADLLVERVTGMSATAPVPVTVNLVVSDHTLFAGGTEPAHLQGYGPVPAGLARTWVHDADASGSAALRKVYARPESGALTAVESRSRCFPKSLAQFIDLRDRECRTPWCDAPIRHHDHLRAHAAGGATEAENGAGLCAACNYAKEGAGWSAQHIPRAGGKHHIIEFCTPTRHRYRSTSPPLPLPNSVVPESIVSG